MAYCKRFIIVLSIICVFFCFSTYSFASDTSSVSSSISDAELQDIVLKNAEYNWNSFLSFSIGLYLAKSPAWNGVYDYIFKNNKFNDLYPFFYVNNNDNAIWQFMDITSPDISLTGGDDSVELAIGNSSYTYKTDSVFYNTISVDFHYYGNYLNIDHASAVRLLPYFIKHSQTPYSFVPSSVLQFNEWLHSNSKDYSTLLNIINENVLELKNYLNSINTNVSSISGNIDNINTTLNLIKDKVSDTTQQQTLDNINNGLNDLKHQQQQIIDEQKNTANTINQGTNVIQNTLTDNDTNNISNGDFVTDDTQDITENGFNDIFNTLYNVFTSNDNSQDVVVPFPFTDKSFTISKSSIYNGFSDLTWLENLSSAFWYFVISLFIVKDISKRFNKIKSGDIENIVNSNVKEDLL